MTHRLSAAHRFLFPVLSVLVVVTLLAGIPLSVMAEGPGGEAGQGATGSLDLMGRRLSPVDGICRSDLLCKAQMDPFYRVLSGGNWLHAAGLQPGSAKFAAFQSPAAQAATVPFRDPAPSFSRNLLITRDYGNAPLQTEPHLAVNPLDPNHVVVGVIDYNFPGVAMYVTFDGGETWEGPKQVRYVNEDLGAAGDPVVAFDRQGNPYVISISIGFEEFLVGNFAVATFTSSISITTSKNGGLDWSDPVPAARRLPFTRLEPSGVDPRLRGQVFIPFLDKPWVTIGPDPADPSKDIIHISYTEFLDVLEVLYIDELPVFATREMQTAIKTVRSTDLGRTWADPVAVSSTVTRASGGGQQGQASEGLQRVVQGSEPRVAPDGTTYISWMDSTDDDSQQGLAEIYIARSDDGGKTYGRPVRASVFTEPGFRPRTAFFRYWGTAFPKLAIGPQGQVYIVYGAKNPARAEDDGDIFFVRSEDKGATFTRAKRLGGDDTPSLQFFPAISVDPDGALHVMWGDMRNDPIQSAYHIYYTTSADKGETWGFVDNRLNLRTDDTRVSDFPSTPNRGFPNGVFIGDYFAIAAAKDEVYMIWADSRLGEFGGFNQKIAFARKRAIVNPEVFISPPTGAGGQEITVQGFNLQPRTMVFVLVGGAVISTERTNDQGRFTAKVFVPVTGEGAQDVRVLDESGNVAGTSYYTEFGFNSIRDQQKKIETQLNTLTGGAPPNQDGGPAAGGPGPAWWMVVAAGVGGLLLGFIALMAARPKPRTPAGP